VLVRPVGFAYAPLKKAPFLSAFLQQLTHQQGSLVPPRFQYESQAQLLTVQRCQQPLLASVDMHTPLSLDFRQCLSMGVVTWLTHSQHPLLMCG